MYIGLEMNPSWDLQVSLNSSEEHADIPFKKYSSMLGGIDAEGRRQTTALKQAAASKTLSLSKLANLNSVIKSKFPFPIFRFW
jgi:hypothetical protein